MATWTWTWTSENTTLTYTDLTLEANNTIVFTYNEAPSWAESFNDSNTAPTTLDFEIGNSNELTSADTGFQCKEITCNIAGVKFIISDAGNLETLTLNGNEVTVSTASDTLAIDCSYGNNTITIDNSNTINLELKVAEGDSIVLNTLVTDLGESNFTNEEGNYKIQFDNVTIDLSNSVSDNISEIANVSFKNGGLATSTLGETFGFDEALTTPEWYIATSYETGVAIAYGVKANDTDLSGDGAYIVISGIAFDDNETDTLAAWNTKYADPSIITLCKTCTVGDEKYTFFTDDSIKAGIDVVINGEYTVDIGDLAPQPISDGWQVKDLVATFTSGGMSAGLTSSGTTGGNTTTYTYEAATTGDDGYTLTITGFKSGTEDKDIEDALANITPSGTKEAGGTVTLTEDVIDLMDTEGLTLTNDDGNWSFKIAEDANITRGNYSANASYVLTEDSATIYTAGYTEGYYIVDGTGTKNKIVYIDDDDTAKKYTDVITGDAIKSTAICEITGVPTTIAATGDVTYDAATEVEGESVTPAKVTIPESFGSDITISSIEGNNELQFDVSSLSSLSEAYKVTVNVSNVAVLVGNKTGTVAFADKITGTKVDYYGESGTRGSLTLDFTSITSTFALEIDKLVSGDTIKLAEDAKPELLKKDQLGTEIITSITFDNVTLKASEEAGFSEAGFANYHVQVGTADSQTLADYIDNFADFEWTLDNSGNLILIKGSKSFITIENLNVTTDNLSDFNSQAGNSGATVTTITIPESLNNTQATYPLNIKSVEEGNDNLETAYTFTFTNAPNIAINRGNVTVINNSSAVSTMAIGAVEEVEVTTGSNSDTITVNASAKNVTVNSGAGDDTITIENGAKGVVINSGAGTDFIRMENDSITISDTNVADIISISGLDISKKSVAKTMNWDNKTKTFSIDGKTIILNNVTADNLDALASSGLQFTSETTAANATGTALTDLTALLTLANSIELNEEDWFAFQSDTTAGSFKLLVYNESAKTEEKTFEFATISGLPETIMAIDLNTTNDIVTKNENGPTIIITLPESLLSVENTNIALTKANNFNANFEDWEVNLKVAEGVEKAETLSQSEWKTAGTNAIYYSAGKLPGYVVPNDSEYKITYSSDTTASRLVTLTYSDTITEEQANAINTTNVDVSGNTLTIGNNSNAIPAGTKILPAYGKTVVFQNAANIAVDSETTKATITGSSYADTFTVDFTGKTDAITGLQIEGGEKADTITLANITGDSIVNVYGGTSTKDDADDTFNIGDSVTGVEIHSGAEDADIFNFTGTGANVTLNLSANDKISIGGTAISDADIKINDNGTIKLGGNTVAVQGISSAEDLIGEDADWKDFKIYNGAGDTEGTTLAKIWEDDHVANWIKSGSDLQYREGDTVLFKISGLTLGNTFDNSVEAESCESITVISETVDNSTKYTVKISDTLLGTTATTVSLDFTNVTNPTHSSTNTSLALMSEEKKRKQLIWTLEASDSNNNAFTTGIATYYGENYYTGNYTVENDGQSITVEATMNKLDVEGFTITKLEKPSDEFKVTNEDEVIGKTIAGITVSGSTVTIGSPAMTTGQFDSENNITLSTDGFKTPTTDFKFELDDKTITKAATEASDTWVLETKEDNSSKTAKYYFDYKSAGAVVSEDGKTISYSEATSDGTVAVQIQNLSIDFTQTKINTVTVDKTAHTVTLSKDLCPDSGTGFTALQIETNYDVLFANDITTGTYTPQGWSASDATTAVYNSEASYKTGYIYNTTNKNVEYHSSDSAATSTEKIKIEGLTIEGETTTARNATLADNAKGITLNGTTFKIAASYITADNQKVTISGDDTTAYTVDFSGILSTGSDNHNIDITVTRKNTNIIGTGKDDTITVSSLKNESTINIEGDSGSDVINVTGSQNYSIVGGKGDDTIEISNSTNITIDGDGGTDNTGEDVIKVTGGSGNLISVGANDEIQFAGTVEATVTLDSSNAGSITFNVTDTDLSSENVKVYFDKESDSLSDGDGKLHLGNVTLTINDITAGGSIANFNNIIVKYNGRTTGTTLENLLKGDFPIMGWTWNSTNNQYIYTTGADPNSTIASITGGFSTNEDDTQTVVTSLESGITLGTGNDTNKFTFDVGIIGDSDVSYSLAENYSLQLSSSTSTVPAHFEFSGANFTDTTLMSEAVYSCTDVSSTIKKSETTAATAQLVLSGLATQASGANPNTETDYATATTVVTNKAWTVPTSLLPETTSVVSVGTNAGYNVTFGAAVNAEVTVPPSADATVTGSDNADTIKINFSNDSTLSHTFVLNGGKEADSINVAAATVGSDGVISLVGGEGADSINIQGATLNDGAKLEIAGSTDTAGDKITLSGITFAENAEATVSVVGGSGVDEISISGLSSSDTTQQVVTVSTGGGNDKVTIDSSSKGISLDLGAGADEVTISGSSDVTIDAATDASDKISINNGSNIVVNGDSTKADTFYLTGTNSISLSGMDSTDAIYLTTAIDVGSGSINANGALVLGNNTITIMGASDNLTTKSALADLYNMKVYNGTTGDQSETTLGKLIDSVSWRVFDGENDTKVLAYGLEKDTANGYIKISNVASTLKTADVSDLGAPVANADSSTYTVTLADGIIDTAAANSAATAVTISKNSDTENIWKDKTVVFALADGMKEHDVDAKWSVTSGTTNTVNYTSAYTQAGYVLTGTTVGTSIYYDSSTSASYSVDISGLLSTTATLSAQSDVTGITVTAGANSAVTVTLAQNLISDDNTTNATIAVADKDTTDAYTFSVAVKDNTTSAALKDATWSLSDATGTPSTKTLAYAIGGVNAGYEYLDSASKRLESSTGATSVIYRKNGSDNTNAFSITGLASTVTIAADGTTATSVPDTLLTLNTSTGKVTITNRNQLAETNVTISGTNTADGITYTFANGFADEGTKTWTAGTDTESTTAIYKGGVSYTLSQQSDTLTYNAGTVYYKVTGLDGTKLKTASDGDSIGSAITVSETSEATTVTVNLGTLAPTSPAADSKIELDFTGVTGNPDKTKYKLAATGATDSMVAAIGTADTANTVLGNYWTVSEAGTADATVKYMTGAHTAGWIVSDYASPEGGQATNAAITYTAQDSGTAAIEIDGINASSLTVAQASVNGAAVAGVSILSGSVISLDSANSKVIIDNTGEVGKALLNGANISIKSGVGGDTYGIELKSDTTTAPAGTSYWTLNESTVQYMSNVKQAYYSNTAESGGTKAYITFNAADSGTALVKLSGIKTEGNAANVSDAANKTAEGFASLETNDKNITISEDGSSITLGSAWLNGSDVRIIDATNTAVSDTAYAGYSVTIAENDYATVKQQRDDNILSAYLYVETTGESQDTQKSVQIMTGGYKAGGYETIASTGSAGAWIDYKEDAVSGTAAVTITGIDASALENASAYESGDNKGIIAFTDTAKVSLDADSNNVVISSDLIATNATAAPTLTGTSASSYGIKLAQEINSETKVSYWTVTNNVVTYMKDPTTAAFKNKAGESGSKLYSIEYTEASSGTATWKLDGINTSGSTKPTVTTNDDGYSELNSETSKISFDATTSTITISDATYLNGKDISIVGAGSNTETNTKFGVKLAETLASSDGVSVKALDNYLYRSTTSVVNYMTEANSAGYTAVESTASTAAYIDYTDIDTGTVLFSISGLKNAPSNSKDSTDSITKINATTIKVESGTAATSTTGKQVITIDSSLMNTTSSGHSDITLAFAEGTSSEVTSQYIFAAPTGYNRGTWAAHFALDTESNTSSVNYRAEGYAEGFKVNNADGDSVTVSSINWSGKEAGDVQFTLTGIDTSKLTKDSDNSITAGLYFDTTNHRVLIDKSALGASDVSISLASGVQSDTYKEWTLAIDMDGDKKYDATKDVGFEASVTGSAWTTIQGTEGIIYQDSYSSGYTIQSATTEGLASIKYVTPTTENVATISGFTASNSLLSSLNSATSGHTITLNKEILSGTNTVTITNPAEAENKYHFALAADALPKHNKEKWAAATSTVTVNDSTVTVGTITYTAPESLSGYSLGYDKDNNVATSVSVNDASGGETVIISGLTEKVSTNAKGVIAGVEASVDGGTTTITIPTKLLAERDVTLSSADGSSATNITLGLEKDAAPVARTANYWTTSVEDSIGTAVYHNKDNASIAGYTLASSGQIIDYVTGEGSTILTMKGLKTNVASKLSATDTALAGATIDSSANTLKLASALIGSDGVTVDAGNTAYNYTLDSKAKLVYGTDSVTATATATLTGSSGNDTLINASGAAVTIDGGNGNNVITAGGKGDSIKGGTGRDTINLGDGTDTVTFNNGKMLINNFDINKDTLSLGENTVTKSAFTAGTGTASTTGTMVLTFATGNVSLAGLSSEDDVTVGDTIYSGNYVFDKDKTKMSINAGYTATSLSAENFGTTATIDASAGKKAMLITGNSAANTITGTAKGDTINGGDGNDSLFGGNGADVLIGGDGSNTLTGGAGNDIFVIGGGNDSITDYSATNMGKDKISLEGATITDSETVEGGLSLIFDNGNAVTLTGANSGTKLSIYNAETKTYETKYYGDHASYDSRRKKVTLGESANATFSIADDAGIVSVDATAATKAVNITGNAKNNVLVASENGSTLNGGLGNDTLIGGDSADVFHYVKDEGKDIIQNYGDGDKISVEGGLASITSASIKGGTDVVFTIGTKTLTVKDGQDENLSKSITINDTSYYFGNKYYFDSNQTKVTMFSTFKGKFDGTTAANEGAVTIDASKAGNTTKITGNSQNNVITGSDKADTIFGGEGDDSINAGAGNNSLNGGAGNDTLIGGTGKDVYAYSDKDGGNDVITSYGTGDKIKILDGEISEAALSGSDVTFTLENGSIKVKDVFGTGTNTTSSASITVVNAKNKTFTYSYTKEESSSGDVYDLLYDNNFTTDEFGIDDISEVSADNYSVGDVKTDTNENLVPEQTALTYGNDDNK